MSEQNHRRERTLLISLVLALFAFTAWREYGYLLLPEPEPSASPPAAEAGPTRFSDIKASATPYGIYFNVDLFYNDAEGSDVMVELDPASVGLDGVRIANARPYTPGRRTVHLSLTRDTLVGKRELKNLRFVFRSKSKGVLAESIFPGPITWPSTNQFDLASSNPADVEDLYTRCVQIIDSGQNLDTARHGLEQILLADPKYVRAYVELARYHMKSNWGPAGLAQAEQALKTALLGEPNHADSLVLLGYVYAHQKRLNEADKAFKQAESIGTPNIWLPVNQGELYLMQKRENDAIQAYRRAIEAPKALPTHERARNEAFNQLLKVLETRKQWAEMDQLHARRVELFPEDLCVKTWYSRFKIRTFGDYATAIPLAATALERGCKDARQWLAEGYLLQWVAALKSGAAPAEADDSFRRGQALIEDPVALMYELARSDKTAIVIPALVKRGFSVDFQGSDGLTPLATSVLNSDIAAARALLRYGAAANKPLNQDGFDVLMLAASRGDKDLVVMLLKNGSNARARTKSGMNAEAIAKAQGFSAIASLLAGQDGT